MFLDKKSNEDRIKAKQDDLYIPKYLPRHIPVMYL